MNSNFFNLAIYWCYPCREGKCWHIFARKMSMQTNFTDVMVKVILKHHKRPPPLSPENQFPHWIRRLNISLNVIHRRYCDERWIVVIATIFSPSAIAYTYAYIHIHVPIFIGVRCTETQYAKHTSNTARSIKNNAEHISCSLLQL